MSSVHFCTRSRFYPDLPPTLSSSMWDELSTKLRLQKTVIVLHGTPCAGKSSLSRKLAEKLQVSSYDHDDFTGVSDEKPAFGVMAAQILHANEACILDTNTLSSTCLTTAQGFSSHLMVLVYSPLKLLVERFFERQQRQHSHMNALGYIFKGFYTLYASIGPEIRIRGTLVDSSEIAVGKIHLSDIEWIESQIKAEAPGYLKEQWAELKEHFNFKPGVQEMFLLPAMRCFAVVQTEQEIGASLEDMCHVLQKFVR
ncbi:MAG: Shikimate kinase [Chlamydiae bacterium]|nr:Shikimate kinase [Chlamydiota bacterium]